MDQQIGRFPFGRPATRRPPRRPTGAADLFILGVYPSALHVRWTSPRDGTTVGALAVDDEPVVFWDGADAGARIADWQDAVDWQPGWGAVGLAGGNGSSGRRVDEHVLTPLGVAPSQVFFTDCLPTYFVKAGPRSQAERITTVYDAFARSSGDVLAVADLPVRPRPGELVDRAVTEERTTLLGQLAESAAPTVVTLGQEAADVFAILVGSPRLVLTTGPDYGRSRTVHTHGRHLEWIALTHPGNRTVGWSHRHRRWMQEQPGHRSGDRDTMIPR